jgi:HK97 family phage prohead protease
MNAQAELLRLRVNGLAAELEFAAARHAVARAAAASQTTGEIVGTFDGRVEGKSFPSGGGVVIEGQAGGTAVDRSGEAFLPGVLESALDKYYRSNPILCYHHFTDQALGVVEAFTVGSQGELNIRARLDEPEPGTALADVYRKVKSGTIKGLSVGGIFKRKMTPQGMRIYSAEIVEISVTPVPMEPGSLFTLAGKAHPGRSPESQLRQLGEMEALVNRLGRIVGAL